MKDKKFTLITGGAAGNIVINGVVLDIIADSTMPLPVDVRVFEDDTYLVLTVDPVMRYTNEHPIRLMTDILEAKPRRPGAVVTKDSSWYAVVHDLDAEPTCRDEWIVSAYGESLRLAEKKGVNRLAIPLLGTVHGTFQPRESMDLLVEQVRSQSFSRLKRIVILAENGCVDELRKMLKELSR